MTVQKAFSGPLAIKERVGTLDAGRLAATDLEPVFRERPAVHRFPGSMAKRVHDLAAHVAERYDGDAARVWTDATTPEELRANLEALPGFGQMKVDSTAAVLARRYGVALAEPLIPDHPTLGDVDSPRGARRPTRPASAPRRRRSAPRRLAPQLLDDLRGRRGDVPERQHVERRADHRLDLVLGDRAALRGGGATLFATVWRHPVSPAWPICS